MLFVINFSRQSFVFMSALFASRGEKEALIIPTAIFGLLGVILIMLRYWEFCMAVPFLAIAYYCFQGAVGLRFTVHVGNVAALESFF